MKAWVLLTLKLRIQYTQQEVEIWFSQFLTYGYLLTFQLTTCWNHFDFVRSMRHFTYRYYRSCLVYSSISFFYQAILCVQLLHQYLAVSAYQKISCVWFCRHFRFSILPALLGILCVFPFLLGIIVVFKMTLLEIVLSLRSVLSNVTGDNFENIKINYFIYWNINR